MNHKSLSLPKISEIKQPDENKQRKSKKILKQFHKTKWSVSPKCLIEGHEGRDVLYICINSKCEQTTRLVCQICFFKSHQKHNEQFLAIDQIKLGEITKLRFWPFDQKYRKMFQFINNHELYISNMIQDVNATFRGMAMRIINSIEKIRISLVKDIDSFYQKQNTKKSFCEKVKSDLQKCFQLKKIRQIVRQIFSKQVRHDIFLDKMKQALNDEQTLKYRQVLSNYFQHSEKGKDMFFDKTYFLKKQNWIIQQIEEQKRVIKTTQVTVDQAEIGLQKILPQALAYLDKNAEGYYPLTFEKKVIEDGSEYLGFLCKGARTMFGRRKYKNGFIYHGEWRINAKNGWGIYQNKGSGYKYSGSWKQDKRNGYGREETLTYAYQGNFLSDKKEGFGVLLQDEVRYEITWKNDKKHGAGKKVDRHGNQSDIYYLNGVETVAKGGKTNGSIDLNDMSKKFSPKTI